MAAGRLHNFCIDHGESPGQPAPLAAVISAARRRAVNPILGKRSALSRRQSASADHQPAEPDGRALSAPLAAAIWSSPAWDGLFARRDRHPVGPPPVTSRVARCSSVTDTSYRRDSRGRDRSHPRLTRTSHRTPTDVGRAGQKTIPRPGETRCGRQRRAEWQRPSAQPVVIRLRPIAVSRAASTHCPGWD